VGDYEARKAAPLPMAAHVPAYAKGLKVLDGAELLTTTFPPRALMLAPWLPEKGLAMIFAPRGVGKTWVALSIAHAIASGGGFLRWRDSRAACSTSTAKCQQ
jgi:AAA domain